MRLKESVNSRSPLIKAARDFRDATGEATFIALWGSHGATIIRYFEGFSPVTVETRAGTVLPLLGTATGHVFLTWLDGSVTSGMLQNSQGYDIEKIKEDTRKAGLSNVSALLLPRIAALAAPVFDMDGNILFSMSTLGWTGDFNCDLEGDLAQKLKAASQHLSASLGYAG